ncbi:MAG: polysaccharide deacetylase family protein [Bacillota bacterium]|nr:polysaccharide deacetylase family protein [Bacillota bacterium]
MKMRLCRLCLALIGTAMLLVSCQPARDPLPLPQHEQSDLDEMMSSTHRKVSQEQAAINAGLLDDETSATKRHDVSTAFGEDAAPPAAAESAIKSGSDRVLKDSELAEIGESSEAAEASETGEEAEPGELLNHKPEFSSYAYDTLAVREAMQNQVALEEGKRIAFLTFDDGIDVVSTPQLLDILKDMGVPATFFMLGQSMHADNRAILERMLDEGHALALHSFNHSYKQLYPEGVGNVDAVLEQLRTSQEMLEETLDGKYSSKVWRYPGGHMSWKNLGPVDDALAELGVHWIDWNALNEDAATYKPTTVDGQVEALLDGWRRFHGEADTMVVLMHDGGYYQLTRESLPAIIRKLRELDFSFGILK